MIREDEEIEVAHAKVGDSAGVGCAAPHGSVAKAVKPLTIQQQQRLYDTLKRIARGYRKPDSILRRPDFGLDGAECLSMAYENIQCEAANAIKGVRRPTTPQNSDSQTKI